MYNGRFFSKLGDIANNETSSKVAAMELCGWLTTCITTFREDLQGSSLVVFFFLFVVSRAIGTLSRDMRMHAAYITDPTAAETEINSVCEAVERYIRFPRVVELGLCFLISCKELLKRWNEESAIRTLVLLRDVRVNEHVLTVTICATRPGLRVLVTQSVLSN